MAAEEIWASRKCVVSPARFTGCALIAVTMKSLFAFRLVDESLGKAGDYPFQDVGGRGVSWRQRTCTCVSFSQLHSSFAFYLV
jgi:hypothetical protein